MTTVDLKEAYLLLTNFIFSPKIPTVSVSRQKNGTNNTYEFTSMPYGLSVAPRTFTKLMKEVTTFLRSRGHSSVVYLDDILCIGKDYNDCLKNVTATISLLECLSFVVNYDKNSLEPEQTCRFLGFI
jgi:hypothetical protein